MTEVTTPHLDAALAVIQALNNLYVVAVEEPATMRMFVDGPVGAGLMGVIAAMHRDLHAGGWDLVPAAPGEGHAPPEAGPAVSDADSA